MYSSIMPVTKQYLRYVPASMFGVVASPKAPVVPLCLRGVKGRYVAVAAVEHVFIWDLRMGEKLLVLKGGKFEVTGLAASPDNLHIAVGYHDGVVLVFSLVTGEVVVVFSGHKAAVTALRYDTSGMRLASGSKDTDVIVWDIVNESGLYRLKGHKGVITHCHFLKGRNFLITSSKDTFVKWWDLDTQHCFRTMVGHRTEVWSFAVTADERRLITGSGDSELRVWDIQYKEQRQEEEEPAAKKARQEMEEEEEKEEEEEPQEDRLVSTSQVGSLLRKGRGRVVSMTLDPTGSILSCHGPDSLLELFRISTEEEIQTKLKKKQKKLRKKLKDQQGGDQAGGQAGDQQAGHQEVPEVFRTLEDEIQRLCNVSAAGKVKSCDLQLDSNGQLKAFLLLHDNSMETITVLTNEKKPEASGKSRLLLPGHRSDVRTVAFSSDNIAMVTGAAETVKLWNRSTQQCIRTMPSGYALCSTFAPGDQQVIVGTKAGKLQIFDIGSGSLLQSVDAHQGALWSIAVSPDKRSLVSGGADKLVKFWDFELINDEKFSSTSKRLSVSHARSLQCDEDVLGVKYSPDHRLLAVALLDNTVKVFYADTLKFFLSLYGHKLPVLAMDISTDGSLLVTGSADRNVKLWGLDFGDCHKSIFAHDDSIMCVQFLPRTHMFFSAGKDGQVKQWDADNFQHILTLEGHQAEVWCMAVSPNRDYVVTGSHDKSLRLWQRTQEPLILEEERETEREKEFEQTLAKGEQQAVPGETSGEAGMAGKKSVETVKAAERVMEAVEIYKEETGRLEEHRRECEALHKQVPGPPPHPMLLAHGNATPLRFVLEVIKKVRSSELEEALLVLPFSCVIDLLKLLNDFLTEGWEVELTCRCLFFLLRIHQGALTSNQVLLPVMDNLRKNTQDRVQQIRDVVGFNLAGLQFLQREMEARDDVTFFADATERFQERKRKKRRKERAVLAIRT
ncbi:WDR3 [Branchiostoma lanceolatum]|uniref:WDR3 protein n=2 Tax=Branchiostoma lanceolatum TaxID=7740 RepID=A0A8J9VWL6_BRALA|nr:WDR3 [Branchiostoma lanceolatum]